MSVADAGGIVKFPVDCVTPQPLVTAIFPVVAPTGTVVEICVLLFTVNPAVVPLNETAEAELKLLPLMVTAVPLLPETGVKEEITGGAPCVVVNAALVPEHPPDAVTVTVKFPAVVTLMDDVVAPVDQRYVL